MPIKNFDEPVSKIAGLPANTDAEKFVLGSILLDPDKFPLAAQIVTADDFSLESHRRIFLAMTEMQMRGEQIDRITLANELTRRSHLDSIGGMTYLVYLDEGLPQLSNIAGYLAIVREKARLRKIIWHSRSLYSDAMLPDAISSEVLASGQASLAQIGDTLDTRGQMIGDYIAEYPGGPNVMLDPSKWQKGVPTGFSVLDDWTDGFHQSEIFLIGARPGVGKSSIGLNIVRYLASQGLLSVFFSLEMSKRICLNRLICERAELSFQRFRRGTLTDDERKELGPAAMWVSGLPIFIDDSSGLTTADIGMRLQSVANKQPVALCVIDFVQLLRGQKGKRYSTENDRYEDIALDLQNLCKRTGIPQLWLSQLTRESEKGGADKRPQLSQCRGSGAWEQAASCGFVLYREEMFRKNRPELTGVTEAIIGKNRSGPVGTVMLKYVGFMMHFQDA